MNTKMIILFVVAIASCCPGCRDIKKDHLTGYRSPVSKPAVEISYDETKQQILQDKAKYAALYLQADEREKNNIRKTIKDYWVSAIGEQLFKYWKGTAWDFNGNTVVPNKGSIACGFFVATILKDMGLRVDRAGLSVCPSSVMMKTLVPHQGMMNLSRLSFDGFIDSLRSAGINVYIIGLDFHTGILINDSNDLWFIHSNYIRRRGVEKEHVENSAALRISKTRWLVNLTSDREFIEKWLRAQKI